MNRLVCICMGTCLLAPWNSTFGQAQQRPDWLIGSADNMRIRIRGEIVNPDESPSSGFQIVAVLHTQAFRQPLAVDRTDNRFTCEIPVNGNHWRRVLLTATSKNGQSQATHAITHYDIREAAVKGIRIELQKFERAVTVRVVHQAKVVPNATVRAALMEGEAIAVTNDTGIAVLPVMNADRLFNLTAWTDDFRVGGFSFHRDPPRDSAGSEFTIELTDCRKQKLRLVNSADGSPIPDLPFSFVVGTGPPNYQFLGETPDYFLRSDSRGEAVCRWFPDWETHGSYPNIADPHWVKERKTSMLDGVLILPFHRSLFHKRKVVTGRVKSEVGSAAGYCVEMRSFQGEEEGTLDILYAFTDETGTFRANFLPDATYCVLANDSRHVSNLVDAIPWKAKSNQTESPELTVREGRAIEITVTAGPNREPVPFQSVNLRTNHDFSWQENGETQHGNGCRDWHVTTNKYGRTYTYALSDVELEGTIYTPEWRSRITKTVQSEGITRLRFHRQFAEARTIEGELVGPDGTDYRNAIVEIGSVDGETKERQTVSADAMGRFQFQSRSARVAIVVRTMDDQLAAAGVFEDMSAGITLQLQKALHPKGQLLDPNERPIANRRVNARVELRGADGFRHPFAPIFRVNFVATTDANGNFQWHGMPTTQIGRQNVWIHLVSDDESPDELLKVFQSIDNADRLQLRAKAGN